MAAGELGDESLARRIYGRAHLAGEFSLRSGATSNEYFDKYLFESDPELLREIAQALVALLPDQVEAVAEAPRTSQRRASNYGRLSP